MMTASAEPNIFFEEKQIHHPINIIGTVDNSYIIPSNPIPYLKKGDSNKYLQQFLCQPEEQVQPPQIKDEIKKQQNLTRSGEDEVQDQSGSQKFNLSAFHNFQKHLTVSLKHSVNVDEYNATDYEMVAVKMWKIFKTSSVSTKKMLHYFLGQNNEHKITKEGLKEYGLIKINQTYGENLMKEARSFLAYSTLRQIKQGKLEKYIIAKKLKNKDKFRKYVQIFTEELQNGFLRKRLPKEKVDYLLHS